MLFGVAFKAAGFIRPSEYGGTSSNIDLITGDFARLVLGVQLVLAGVQLPPKYIWHQKWSLFILLVPVMSIMWIVSASLILVCIPGLKFIQALIIASCVTPTDPVLCNSIVKGKFAEKHVPEALRNIISAESGANDGEIDPVSFAFTCVCFCVIN